MHKPLCALTALCVGGLFWLVLAYQIGQQWGRAYPNSAAVWRTTDRIEDWRYLTQPWAFPRWHEYKESEP